MLDHRLFVRRPTVCASVVSDSSKGCLKSLYGGKGDLRQKCEEKVNLGRIKDIKEVVWKKKVVKCMFGTEYNQRI